MENGMSDFPKTEKIIEEEPHEGFQIEKTPIPTGALRCMRAKSGGTRPRTTENA
jgi:hypothetical protein